MPRFSVIVPAYKVQAYLHECLESVLSQSFEDLELIAVDDCSPDGCGAVIDEFAARDRRVVAVHLPGNAGLGPARNAGLARATGDYVLFLDGDDTFVPGALQAVADRLKETGSPDLLVYDYARVYWSGEAVRHEFRAHLSEAGPAPFPLTDRPGLLKVLMVVWNKAYKREFLEREGFAFPPGFYEDTPWTYPALMAAESIATLDRVCVHYRQRRTGSILRTTSHRHFDLFEQYERVFAFIDARPELARWRAVLFRRMADHFTSVFSARGRLPRGTRADFFRRARRHYRRFRTPGATPKFTTRLRHALVRLGSHRAYRAIMAARALKKRAGQGVSTAARAVRGALLQLHYRVQRCLPLREDRAVFAAYWNRGYACSPAAVEERVRELAPHVRTAWVCGPEHFHTVPPATRRVRPGSAAYWTALARSKYLVNNVNFDRRLVKRRGQLLIQTHHGTPLKHMGLDLQYRPAAARDMDFARLLRAIDQWDAVVSANRHSSLVWERVYPAAYRTLEFGSPRNDVFQRATAADVARLRETLGIPEGHTAILYAPTHRDYVRPQPHLVDLERLLRALGPRFVILARPHPTHGSPFPVTDSPRVIDVSDHPSVERLCLASDALLTDYSSLMFDYAVLDRPIVVHAEDWAAYDAARGTYFDVRAFPPGAVARTEDELIDIFATGHWRGSRSAQLRAAFRARFCPYDDGYAAERVVRHLFLGEDLAALPPVVPMEDRRPAPSLGGPGAALFPAPR
ncbi:CDP-glycerol:glycerophosphate glycerophosphotransferase [Streptomyces sp. WAC05374]|uniref:bifunctional glycosyltransferase/CDP-glycerol:glycerophosphate glycerophosphotransferase n=1 Tax=Streptomyces sp. WAC05374 TaxID=2487420 RepID=UPI000F869157|nr:bifunctional glycosyltransferase family 2 protein/CDP-glycerol:glycerophosphate glycerophosphotransferase [Streptomyces sp. WAC05374]RST09764.1 CDP-glycerol:glycerophosphate glycerophosphotransferase [Streptomyces sp. WAC05374]TDF44411.1 CDP-glycerol:glycerophosphate glycerophosphotransferase [Streptomyces sp. WAC05374]TDF44983.1 CDP-glycerol:glycerophosphate glycerophosphotransferase [Streptomyces sp. WAC05374]TDF58492.1 CDP-glycerol:glycerophosphate glycerophosphotransferase [Streptomyces 